MPRTPLPPSLPAPPPPGLSFRDHCDYKAFVAEQRREYPEADVPSIPEWLEYRNAVTELQRNSAATGVVDATPGPQGGTNHIPALDPRLYASGQDENTMSNNRMHTSGHRRSHDEAFGAESEGEADVDADDEAEDLDVPVRKRSKFNRLLTIPKAALTKQQSKTLKELRKLVRKQMYTLTGLNVNPFTLKAGQDEPKTPPVKAGCMPVTWGQTVNHNTNATLLDRATELIWEQETRKPTDPQTWTHTHKDVVFTKDDVLDMAKGVLRGWQSSYTTKVNPVKRQKALAGAIQTRRIQRQRDLCKNRRQAVQLYLEENEDEPDPTPFLVTPNMTEENSEFSEDDDEVRAELTKKKLAAAGLTAEEAKDLVVLERRPPGWRATTITMRLHELDNVYGRVSRMKKTRPTAVHRRVNLGRTRDTYDPDKMRRLPAPILISRSWLKRTEVEVKTKKRNPQGWTTEEGTDTEGEGYGVDQGEGSDSVTMETGGEGESGVQGSSSTLEEAVANGD